MSRKGVDTNVHKATWYYENYFITPMLCKSLKSVNISTLDILFQGLSFTLTSENRHSEGTKCSLCLHCTHHEFFENFALMLCKISTLLKSASKENPSVSDYTFLTEISSFSEGQKIAIDSCVSIYP